MKLQVPMQISEVSCPIRAGPLLSSDSFTAIRRLIVLEHCKWDPQVGDISTLAPFPLFIKPLTWRQLAAWTERLAAESAAAESEILERPDLQKILAVPRSIRQVYQKALKSSGDSSAAAARIARFDFHWTRDGWKVSEMNSDVPGGLTEASAFTALYAECCPGTRPAGDPAGRYAMALSEHSSGPIALLSATGYMEDLQVVAYLAKRLQALGVETHLARPEQIRWREGRAEIETAWCRLPLGAVVRFYQAEWLPRLGRHFGWRRFFSGSQTPVFNPGSALITESKRFPLIWDRLRTPLLVWRQLCPESRCLQKAPWRTDKRWLIKSAFSNNGDAVAYRQFVSSRDWRSMALSAWLCSGNWVAQRRFESVPVETPWGPMHVCLGVYAVGWRSAGIYGRLSPKPLIDFEAMDVPVLIEAAEEKLADHPRTNFRAVGAARGPLVAMGKADPFRSYAGAD